MPIFQIPNRYPMRTVFRKLRYFFRGDQTPPAPPEQVIVVSDSSFNNYSFVIGSLFSYFNDLSVENKMRFVQRVHHFKSTKKFHYIGLEENDDTATLVSASAIQMTFGLKNYLLSHFENIYILADAYRMENDEEL